MGNTLTCMPKKGAAGQIGSRSTRTRSNRKMDEEMIHKQALSMAIQQHLNSQRFEGSMSRRVGASTSSRRLRPTAADFSDSFKQEEFIIWKEKELEIF